MKVIAINGSARKDGNTAILIRHLFAELEKEGIETELVQLAARNRRLSPSLPVRTGNRLSCFRPMAPEITNTASGEESDECRIYRRNQ